MPRLITCTVVKVYRPFVSHLSDVFQTEEQITIEWISTEERVSLFNGLYKYEKGASETFTVRGKPGFCAAVLSELSKHGTIIDKRPQSASVNFWIHLSGRRA